MRTYNDLKSLLHTGLGSPAEDDPYFYPGPADPDLPGSKVVVLTRTGGAGLQLEGLTDSIGWQAKVMGLQNDYDSAESLAIAIDTIILNLSSSTVAGYHLVSAQRAGEPPAPLLVDNAQRTHFVCSYLFEVQSYVAPI